MSSSDALSNVSCVRGCLSCSNSISDQVLSNSRNTCKAQMDFLETIKDFDYVNLNIF